MVLGLNKTIKNCGMAQLKMAVASLGYGVIYVVFMVLFLHDDGEPIAETIATVLSYFSFIFIILAMMFQTNYIRTNASVMLMLGDTRKNVSIGRHFSTMLFILEGGVIACLPMIVEKSDSFEIKNVLLSIVAIVIASGIGMISEYFAQRFGTKFQMITTIIFLCVIGSIAGVFFGLGGFNLSMDVAVITIMMIVAVVLYAIGAILSKSYIKNMEVSV